MSIHSSLLTANIDEKRQSTRFYHMNTDDFPQGDRLATLSGRVV
jgi:hypothetical protein